MTEEQIKAEGITSLPKDLNEAISEMEQSELLRETLGDHIFNKYIDAKKEEWSKYITQVTPWELEHYLTRY